MSSSTFKSAIVSVMSDCAIHQRVCLVLPCAYLSFGIHVQATIPPDYPTLQPKQTDGRSTAPDWAIIFLQMQHATKLTTPSGEKMKLDKTFLCLFYYLFRFSGEGSCKHFIFLRRQFRLLPNCSFVLPCTCYFCNALPSLVYFFHSDVEVIIKDINSHNREKVLIIDIL